MHSIEQLLRAAALVCAAVSAIILIWYIARRPPLGRLTKVLLLLGLGLMPLGVALTGNIAGYEYTLERRFCASCHVMTAYVQDSENPNSKSLTAIHSRNRWFGGESCYTCHEDYRIFGAVTTKVNGLRHLYAYVTEYANTGPNGEGGPPIKMYHPFQNSVCIHCHSTTAPRWSEVPEHGAMLADLRSGETSCLTCHTEVHPTALAHRPAAQGQGQKPSERAPRPTASPQRAGRRAITERGARGGAAIDELSQPGEALP